MIHARKFNAHMRSIAHRQGRIKRIDLPRTQPRTHNMFGRSAFLITLIVYTDLRKSKLSFCMNLFKNRLLTIFILSHFRRRFAGVCRCESALKCVFCAIWGGFLRCAMCTTVCAARSCIHAVCQHAHKKSARQEYPTAQTKYQ